MGERFGAWSLDALIAVGGIGEVWRASGPGGIAAVKRMHTHLLRHDEARELFSVEQKLAMTLPHHPNVVHGLDAGEVDERPYVALSLAPGEDLRRIVAPVSPDEKRVVAIAACDAAGHMHAHGWVHGDINPGNLVIDARPDGDRVVLIDLGVARTIGAGGSVRGTHAYMAPEQVRGEAWTPATDVFAIGVIVWELVMGTRLFHRGPPWLSMAAVMEETPASLPDPVLDAIVKAALAKDPTHRTMSADALGQRLRALRGG
jgi:eukaryotic-like serine/threonine-protein kinase